MKKIWTNTYKHTFAQRRAIRVHIHFGERITVKDDVHRARTLRNVFFGSQNNDGDGFTNGFYMGHVTAVRKVLSTWGHLHFMADAGLQGTDYERLLKLNCVKYGIERRVLKGFASGRRLNRKRRFRDFIKIRANGEIFGPLKCEMQMGVDLSQCPMLAHVPCEGNVQFDWAINSTGHTSCDWYESID